MAKNKIYMPGQFFLVGLIIALAIIVADQYSKWLVMETMLRKTGDTPDFLNWLVTRRPLEFFVDQRETYNTVKLTSFLNLVMVWNTGVSFGFLAGGSMMISLLLTGLALFVAALMLVWLSLTASPAIAAALTCVVGGAIANAIDRVRFGAVADFIDFFAGTHHWPAFNLADSAIVLGAMIMIYDMMTTKERRLK